jgi:hypothetical protein
MVPRHMYTRNNRKYWDTGVSHAGCKRSGTLVTCDSEIVVQGLVYKMLFFLFKESRWKLWRAGS